jgi:hypothetical protein
MDRIDVLCFFATGVLRLLSGSSLVKSIGETALFWGVDLSGEVFGVKYEEMVV